MIKITLDHLKTICGAPDSAAQFIDPLNIYMDAYQINTHVRICGFLGQVAEESAAFSRTLEEASGKRYEGRRDLGNIQPGDGVKFKGRGLIQITGRNGYQDASMHLYKDRRLLIHPELLEAPDGAVMSACWYWFSRGLNGMMDVSLTHRWKVKINGKPMTMSTYQWATEKINGGQNGYADRLKFFQKALEVIPKVESAVVTLDAPSSLSALSIIVKTNKAVDGTTEQK